MGSMVRGIRGAVTIDADTSAEVLSASEELLKAMLEKNGVPPEEICAVFFTVTPDITSEFPAKSARNLGLVSTPLMCMTEIPVRDAIKKCIRILIQFNTNKPQSEIKHVYLRDARVLRPDIPE